MFLIWPLRKARALPGKPAPGVLLVRRPKRRVSYLACLAGYILPGTKAQGAGILPGKEAQRGMFFFCLPGKVRILPGKEAQGTDVMRSKKHVSSLACRVRPVSCRAKKAQWAGAVRGKEA